MGLQIPEPKAIWLVPGSKNRDKNATYRRKSTSRAGLSVLEALAALTLIALAFLPMLALQSRLSQTARAIERAELRNVISDSVRAVAESINPMMRPEGQETIGEAILTWRSAPVSAARRARGLDGDLGRFELQLFDVEFTITESGRASATYVVRRLGWRALAPATQS